MYLSWEDRGNLASVIANWPESNVEITAEKHDNSTAEKIIKQSSSVRTFGLLVDLGPLLATLSTETCDWAGQSWGDEN
jgi:hypothetical protein